MKLCEESKTKAHPDDLDKLKRVRVMFNMGTDLEKELDEVCARFKVPRCYMIPQMIRMAIDTINEKCKV